MVMAALHAHDEYSLLDGAGSAIQHAQAAAEAGYLALANTNHCTLAGSLHHIAACNKVGISPITGCEVYYRPNRKVQKQAEWKNVYYHLTILAKNERGWRNLMALVSEAHDTGFYNKACVDDELLEKYKEDLMVLTGCPGGRLIKSINADDDRQAEGWFRQLKRMFKDDLYAEIMPHDLDIQRKGNLGVIEMAQRHGVPLVTTVDTHYPTQEWSSTQDVLLMIATNQNRKERQKKRDEGEDVYTFDVKTLYHLPVEMIRWLYATYHPQIHPQIVEESIRNTMLVAAKTTPFLIDKTEKMPSVAFEGWQNNADYLRQKAFEGLAAKGRGYENDPEYVDGTNFELNTFESRNQTNYMAMVQDIIAWCKSDLPVPKRTRDGRLVYGPERKKPIMVGPGRGSAAGSKVAWELGITNLNPVKYRCLFERFVNPDRVGLPDIDIDLPPDRVDEVEDYIKARFGKNAVVDIIAHSTFGPRAALSDVGRVLSLPYDHIKAATKTISDQEDGALVDIAKVNPAVNKLAEQYPELWTEACRIQGMVARKSEHAGGVLILPGDVSDYIPVERTGGMKGKLLSAFGERAGQGNALISDYGYTKIDVLRVAELTKQQHCIDLIFERTGQRIDLDALEIHDDPYAADPQVMQGFKDGKLVGIFQFSATAMKLTRQLKPDNILDLALINAGIRPGPRGVGADQRAARRKNGLEPVTYWHPLCEPFMDYTYGEMFFQEQLIEVAHHLGGLTKAEADIMRKIASKLYRDPTTARAKMSEWEERVKTSMKEKGVDQMSADMIWDNMMSFTQYSFNLAHAAGYSVLAYRDMWLKTYFPREFYAAFLSKGLSKVTKKRIAQKAEAVREARSLGLAIMPPDIMESGPDYTVVEGGIRLGLEAIRNVGPAAARAIVDNRPYASLEEFEKKVPAAKCNRTAKASMVMAGAMDRWNKRAHLTEEKIDELERDTIGMSLTSVYSIQQFAGAIDGKFWTEEQVENAPDGTRVAVMGEVIDLQRKTTKTGNPMIRFKVAYGPNHWDCVMWHNNIGAYIDLLESRRPLLITGDKDSYQGRTSIKISELPKIEGYYWQPAISDLADYVEMMGWEAEYESEASLFPEDMLDEFGRKVHEDELLELA